MRVITTGSSYTTTYNVSFALYYEGNHDEGNWFIAPPIAEVMKGYSTGHYKYCIVPSDKYIEVKITGSGNPNTGPTPEDFKSDPLRYAQITLNGVPYPPPKEEELKTILMEGIRQMADLLPGRKCPYPPLKERWGQIPRFHAWEALDIARQIGHYPAGWLYGKIPLKGIVKNGCFQRGFFITANPQIWRLGWLLDGKEEEKFIDAPFGSHLRAKEVRMGHHIVKFSTEFVTILAARSVFRDQHEWVEALIYSPYEEVTVEVVDIHDMTVTSTVIKGSVLMVHWPQIQIGWD